MKSFFTNSKKKNIKAFTLVELLVSITIIAIMAVLSISAYPKFSAQIGVVAETYKILAYGRETQVFGTSAYVVPGTKIAYGFVIEKNNNTIKRVIITNPTDKTNQYYVTNFTEDTTTNSLKIKDQYKISKICFNDNCTQEGDKIYIIFRRPNPEAKIIGLVGTVIYPDSTTGNYTRAEITLSGKNDSSLFKNIVILGTGQIYVK